MKPEVFGSMQKFSDYLRRLRKRAGLTQEELARALEVSNTYIHQLETGKIDAPTEERCRQLAMILSVESDEIWEIARRERLLRYARREGIDGDFGLDSNGVPLQPPLSEQELALVKLIRCLDEQTLRHFNDTVYMLLRYVPQPVIQETLRAYLESSRAA